MFTGRRREPPVFVSLKTQTGSKEGGTEAKEGAQGGGTDAQQGGDGVAAQAAAPVPCSTGKSQKIGRKRTKSDPHPSKKNPFPQPGPLRQPGI